MEPLDRRNDMLLFYLLEADGYLTSQQLAKKLSVSDRTVRSGIAKLSATLAKNGVEIVASRGKGYLLPEGEKPKARELLLSGRAADEAAKQSDTFSELLYLAEPEDADELSDRLFISRSTLENALRQVKRELVDSGSDLTLLRRKNKVFIQGSEHSKRAFIIYHMDNVLCSPTSHHLMGYTPSFPYKKLAFVTNQLGAVLRKRQLAISDQGGVAVATYIMIATDRIARGFTFDSHYLTEEERAACTAELAAAREIFEKLEGEFAIAANGYEEEALASYLYFRRSIGGEEHMRENLEKEVAPQYLAAIKEALCDIRDIYLLDLTRDEDLYVGLAYHLQGAIEKSDRQSYINPILEDIRGKYPFVFELAIFLRNKFLQTLGVAFDESETAYLAVHLGAAVERLKRKNKPQKIKVSLVCSASAATARFLMAKLLSLYGNRLYLCGPYSVFDGPAIQNEKPDLVISTSTAVMEWVTDIPVAYIHPIPDEKDTKQVARMLEEIERDSVSGLAFQDFFSEAFFFPMLEAGSSSQVIDHMADALAEAGVVQGEFKESTFQRETFSTTVLQNGIAMPHPGDFYSTKTTIAVATLARPVEWGGSKAQIVFMLAVKRGEQQFLRDFYQLIVNLSDSADSVQKVLRIRDFHELLAYFSDLTALV